MSDAIQDAIVTVLVALASLTLVSLAAWVGYLYLCDDPFGLDGVFRGE